MSNAIEICETPEGRISFDHSTMVIEAHWANGERERWSPRGCSYAQKLKSFYMLSDQWDRIYGGRS